MVSLPSITAWRLSITDRLLDKAKNSQDVQLRYSYLKQANIIGFRDSVASNELAQFWIDRGEYKKAIDVYRSSIKDPNNVALGVLALKARDYELANKYFQTATGQNPTAESNAGEAIALYNLDKISEGCDKSNTAIKLNLNSELANKAIGSCKILGGVQSDTVINADISNLSERDIGYRLVDSLVFNQGEKRINAISEKTALDYLILSRLLASRGEIEGAIIAVEKGIEIDRSIIDLYTHAIKLYELKEDSSKITSYQNRVEQLKFEKYQ
jgi:tetratricopeptide (TPR) repeat protein